MFRIAATICAALFAGAALYISIVEQPARLLSTTDAALSQFRFGFPRARALQASLAIVGAACAVVAWHRGAGSAWLLTAACLISVVIFTITVITPVYTALVDPALLPSAPEARPLLERWGRLHLVRAALGLAALVSCVWSLARQ